MYDHLLITLLATILPPTLALPSYGAFHTKPRSTIAIGARTPEAGTVLDEREIPAFPISVQQAKESAERRIQVTR